MFEYILPSRLHTSAMITHSEQNTKTAQFCRRFHVYLHFYCICKSILKCKYNVCCLCYPTTRISGHYRSPHSSSCRGHGGPFEPPVLCSIPIYISSFFMGGGVTLVILHHLCPTYSYIVHPSSSAALYRWYCVYTLKPVFTL